MTSRDFCYWLQGFFEIAKPSGIYETEIDMIRNHLNMVFIHEIDPSFGVDQQDSLNQAHNTQPYTILRR